VTEEVPGYLKENSRNESCIDNIDLYIDIKDDKINDIKFSGEACAISTASTSIMIKNLIGKSISDALKYMEEFDNMLEEKEFDSDIVGEAQVFDETYKQINRRTCVILPYKGIKRALKEYLTKNN
jgi:nitrogen fixation NifU-like protein